MKIRNFVFPCLLALGLCSCNFHLKSVSGVRCQVKPGTRKNGDNFDVDDIKASLVYGENDFTEVEFKNFDVYNLSAVCIDPNGVKSDVLTTDFVLETIGTYTIEVTYTPRTNYSFPCTDSDTFEVEQKIIPVTSITLNTKSITIREEETASISYSLSPSDNTTKTATLSSNDETVATVDQNGKITAVREGQCLISAEADGVVEECLVTVIPTVSTKFVFNSRTFDSNNGNWIYSKEGFSFNSLQNLGVQINEETTIKSPLTFDKICSIKIECGTANGSSDDDTAGYISTFVDGTEIKSSKLAGFNKMLSISHKVSNLSGEVGIIIKPENCPIYIKSVTIVFSQELVYPTSISLSGNDTIAVGENGKITIAFTPESTSERIIEWSSSKEEVLTVNIDGTIHGVKEGTATVTAQAKCEEGFFIGNSIDVTVIKIPVTSLSLNTNTIEMYEKKTQKLSYSILPSNASYQNVTFTSSNPNVATVDSSGNVTGINPGNCVITCTSEDNPSAFAKCNVSIIAIPRAALVEMKKVMNDYYKLNAYETDSAPSLGTVNLLVVPVWFTDSSNYISSKANVRSDIEKAYFGTSADTGWESVKTFYEKESNGKLTFTGTVSEWYECGEKFSNYNYSTGYGVDSTSSLVLKATKWYFNNHTSDSRKNYDNDGDGYIDGIMIIYGGPDYNAYAKEPPYSNWGDNLWAYTYWIQNPAYKSTSSPGANAYFWASYDFMYNDKTAFARTGKSNYNNGGINEHLLVDSHTYVHEMGHVFGLEDYYDYSGQYTPAGGFSMQDANVGGHDPFSCLALGWAEAYVPTENCEVELEPFQTSHKVILLSPSFNNYNSPFDEYLLLELYTPTGLNKFDTDYQYSQGSPRGVNATGIRLWHVDCRLFKYKSGTPSASTIYTYPVTDCGFMMSNTYYSSGTKNSISPLGKSYADYNMLQLIRNSVTSGYKPNDYLKESYLFRDGSSFKMYNYKNQFVQSGKLNSGKALGWEFSVSIQGSGDSAVATISLTLDK